jgi:hypothetical protein
MVQQIMYICLKKDGRCLLCLLQNDPPPTPLSTILCTIETSGLLISALKFVDLLGNDTRLGQTLAQGQQNKCPGEKKDCNKSLV